MAARIEIGFPTLETTKESYSDKRFVNERIDKANFSNLTFEFCTFEKMGFRGTKFQHCTFKHCEFIDCYLVGSEYEHCDFLGSHFDSCQFAWAKFPESHMDYVRFSHCAPVLMQVLSQKPKDPQAAAKFCRNLAFEHRNLGNWQEVDRLIQQSYKERERHFWYASTGENKHYREHYNGPTRLKYGARWLLSKINGAVWGYGVSWSAFARSGLILCLVILPLLNMTIGTIRDRGKFFWTANPIGDMYRYSFAVYKTTAEAFLPFIPASLLSPATDISLPSLLVVSEAALGTIWVALFASLIFRAAAKGT